MKTLTIKNVTLGEGMPKICVALTGKTRDEILKQAEAGDKSPASLLEWRCDHYIFNSGLTERCTSADTTNIRECIEDIVCAVKETSDKPLILTLRTVSEGGALDINKREYYSLIRDFVSEAEKGKPEIVDVEAFDGDEGFDEEKVRFIAGIAEENGIAVLLSHHNISGSYPEKESLRRLRTMDGLGADISKLVTMAKTKEDMYELMAAAKEFGEDYAQNPYIVLAMGEQGVESRVCGGSVGSAVSFSFIGEPSAPGQIPVEDLDRYIREYHAAEEGK